MSRKYKWVIEITVDKCWVDDGFNLTNDNIKDHMGNLLPYAYGSEFDAKVLEAPIIK